MDGQSTTFSRGSSQPYIDLEFHPASGTTRQGSPSDRIPRSLRTDSLVGWPTAAHRPHRQPLPASTTCEDPVPSVTSGSRPFSANGQIIAVDAESGSPSSCNLTSGLSQGLVPGVCLRNKETMRRANTPSLSSRGAQRRVICPEKIESHESRSFASLRMTGWTLSANSRLGILVRRYSEGTFPWLRR
jgi:hypothetical protein